MDLEGHCCSDVEIEDVEPRYAEWNNERGKTQNATTRAARKRSQSSL